MESKIKKNAGTYALGLFLITAGIGHLTFARKKFQAQVPEWVPLKKDDTIFYSGIAEIALGSAIIGAEGKQKNLIGKVAATFFAAVFPGNISQYVNHKDSFGLNTDSKRLARLFMQPLLILLALKSTSKNS